MATRVAFIGCGGIAEQHISALQKIEDVQVTACMDVDEEKAATAAARFPGAQSYGNVKQMLKEQKLDTAYVCVPPHGHGESELELIKRGIPFFVEKPIGNDRETPTRILNALKRKKLLTCVGYMFRYRASVERVKQHLVQDQPVLARGAWIGGMPGVYWWRRKAMSGGQLMEQTTHVFDLARYLFGEVRSVFCRGQSGLVTDVPDYDVEDASVCTLTFESGLVCAISSSCAVKMGEVSLEVFTRNARLKLFDWNLNLRISRPGETCEVASTEDTFAVEDKVWIEAVQSADGAKIKSAYADAHMTQMVCCAANESLASGKPTKP